jgi:hypothetical protein
MVRLVRSTDRDREVPNGLYPLEAMPQLEGVAHKRYEACVHNRICELPANKYQSYRIVKDKKIPYSHRPSYDAEPVL